MTRAVSNSSLRVTDVYDTLHSGTLVSAVVGALVLSAETFPIYQAIVQADPGNAANIRVGNNLRQDFILAAGAALTIPIDRLNKVYVWFPAAGGTVNWLAMG